MNGTVLLEWNLIRKWKPTIDHFDRDDYIQVAIGELGLVYAGRVA